MSLVGLAVSTAHAAEQKFPELGIDPLKLGTAQLHARLTALLAANEAAQAHLVTPGDFLPAYESPDRMGIDEFDLSSEDEDAQEEALRSMDEEVAMAAGLLSPPVSMSLAISSRFRVRPYVGLFILGAFVSLAPMFVFGAPMEWCLGPAAFLLVTQVHSLVGYSMHLTKREKRLAKEIKKREQQEKQQQQQRQQASELAQPDTAVRPSSIDTVIPINGLPSPSRVSVNQTAKVGPAELLPPPAASDPAASAAASAAASPRCPAPAPRAPVPPLGLRILTYLRVYTGWRLDLEAEQAQDDVPSWTALLLTLGFAWVVVVALLVGMALRERHVRTCGGLEFSEQLNAGFGAGVESCGLSGVGGGVSPGSLLAALASDAVVGADLDSESTATGSFLRYQGHIVLSVAYTGGPFLWPQGQHVEQVPLCRILFMVTYVYFIVGALVSLVLMWGTDEGNAQLVKATLKSKMKKSAKRAKAKEEFKHRMEQQRKHGWVDTQGEAAAASTAAAAALSPASSLPSSSPSPPVLTLTLCPSPTASLVRRIAVHFRLHGCLYLLDVSDRMAGLDELLRDEGIRRVPLATKLGRINTRQTARPLPATTATSVPGASPFSPLSPPPTLSAMPLPLPSSPSTLPLDLLVRRDPFLLQYLILLELIGSNLVAAKLWGVRWMDKACLTKEQFDRAVALRVYEPDPVPVLMPVEGESGSGGQGKEGAKHAEEDSSSDDDDDEDDPENPSGPDAVVPPPPIPSRWKLSSLLVALLVSLWLPAVLWIWYRDFLGLVEHVLACALIPFVCALTYLAGRVLHFPWLCYRENWLAMLAMYHTRLKLSDMNELKVWRDLRHYLVLYRMPVLFGLAQWSLMALLLLGVVGVLICSLLFWLGERGFREFTYFGPQALLLMSVVSLAWSWAMLQSAGEVWAMQQSHIRLLQDQKFAMMLRARKEERSRERARMLEQARKAAREAAAAAANSAGSEDPTTAAHPPAAPSPSSLRLPPSLPSSNSSSSSSAAATVLQGVDELMLYIATHDRAPSAFGVEIKSTLFRALQGYVLLAAISLLARYGKE